MACDIDKPLATHWARRTCGMLMLNKGYSIEVVAKVLGHSDIKTTQHCYAKILDRTVIDSFKKIENVLESFRVSNRSPYFIYRQISKNT